VIRPLSAAAVLAVAVVVLLGGVPGAAASPDRTFVVTTTADTTDANRGDGVCADAGGHCSLRAAIMEASAVSGLTEIDLGPATYPLTLGSALVVDGNVSIVGAGSTSTFIDASGNGANAGLTVEADVVSTVSGITVENAGSDGIDVGTDAPAVFTDVAVVDEGDVGISSQSDLTIRQSSVTGNGDDGVLASSTLQLADSTVSDNDSNGVEAQGGSATLTHDSIDSNADNGVSALGDVSVSSSTVSDSGLKGVRAARATLVDDTVSGSSGVGVDLLGDSTITGTTVSGGLGLGIWSEVGSLDLTNSTVSGNEAGGVTGAGGIVTLVNDTIAGNSGGAGLGVGTQVDVENTIVAGNTPANCSTTAEDLGNDLESTNTCGFAGLSDIRNTDPLLGPLANNGGPTFTEALDPSSAAVDAGNDSACPATDQRGTSRPQGAHCDIGAFELVHTGGGGAPASPTLSTVQASSATAPADGLTASTITVTLKDTAGNPVAGKTVTLSAGSGSSTIATVSGTTGGSGVATFTVKDVAAQTVAYTAHDTTDGVVVTQTASVTFTALGSSGGLTTTGAPPPARAQLPAGQPSAAFTYSPPVASTGAPITFTSTSTDATEPIVSTSWSFGDGGSSAGTTVTHGFAQAGTFTVTMTVRDLTGATATTSRPVLVASGGLVATPASVPANGTARASLSFQLSSCGGTSCPETAEFAVAALNGSSTIVDRSGAPIAQLEQTFAYGGSVSDEIFVRDTTVETVTYLVEVIWGTNAQTFTTQVAFTPLAAASKSTVLVLAPATHPADGKSTATAVVRLRDASGAALTGKQVSLEPVLAAGAHAGMPGHARTAATVTTNAQGIATFSLRDAWPEGLVVEALDTTDGISVAPTSAAARTAAIAHFTPALGVSAARSAIVTTAPTALSGSVTGPTVTVLLRNNLGGAVPGKTVTLLSTHSGRFHPASVTTDATGAASFTVTDPNSETASFSGIETTDKIPLPQQAAVRFVDHVVDAATSTVSADRSSMLADGLDSSHVTVTLRDAAGNPMGSDQVSLHASGGHAAIAPATASTNSNGVATFVVVDSTAESATYTAVAGAGSGHLTDVTQTATLAFTTPQLAAVTFNVLGTTNFGAVPDEERGFTVVLAVTAKDALGVPLAGKQVRAVAPDNPPFYPESDGSYNPGYEADDPGFTDAHGVVILTFNIRSVICFAEQQIEIGVLPGATVQTLQTPFPPSPPWLGTITLPCYNSFR
jgi:CSLREA domain-containing protein